ncbi:hypothetical protein SBA6_1200001 [Candidatus Sulfopaludibacter sp. SbA6]|nr:hypothetical protein SBA6_1200001 [Candidatus Sulfopaludibacter sp. SbA6]
MTFLSLYYARFSKLRIDTYAGL